MIALEHDGAASLRVKYLASVGFQTGRNTASGWYVVRVCPCHPGETITRPFKSREGAECALRVLDEDARRYATA
jgi:hypothetical protein